MFLKFTIVHPSNSAMDAGDVTAYFYDANNAIVDSKLCGKTSYNGGNSVFYSVSTDLPFSTFAFVSSWYPTIYTWEGVGCDISTVIDGFDYYLGFFDFFEFYGKAAILLSLDAIPRSQSIVGENVSAAVGQVHNLLAAEQMLIGENDYLRLKPAIQELFGENIGGAVEIILLQENTGINYSASVSRTQHLQAAIQVFNGVNHPASIRLPIFLLASPQHLTGVNQSARIGRVQSLSAMAQSNIGVNQSARVKQSHVLKALANIGSGVNASAQSRITHIVISNPQISHGVNAGAAVAQTHVLLAAIQSLTGTQTSVADKYLGITYSPENKSITTFSNFNFDGACVFNGKTLLFNQDGIFVYGGDTDNGAPIQPSLKTGLMDEIMGKLQPFRSQHLKKIPTSKVYIDADKQGGELALTVTADKSVNHYATAIQHDGFATHAVGIGRGIKYNRIQFELRANGCRRLDIASIMYEPTEIRRSER